MKTNKLDSTFTRYNYKFTKQEYFISHRLSIKMPKCYLKTGSDWVSMYRFCLILQLISNLDNYISSSPLKVRKKIIEWLVSQFRQRDKLCSTQQNCSLWLYLTDCTKALDLKGVIRESPLSKLWDLQSWVLHTHKYFLLPAGIACLVVPSSFHAISEKYHVCPRGFVEGGLFPLPTKAQSRLPLYPTLSHLGKHQHY